MPAINFLSIAIASLVPLIIGFFYYNPKAMGAILAKENNVNIDEPKGHHPKVYILTLIGSLLIAMLLGAILSTHKAADINLVHGMFHGCMASIFMGIPTFMIIALFENKSTKYILIHALYWFISFGIMGAILGSLN